MTNDRKLRNNTAELKRERDIPCFKVIGPVNDRFTAAVYCCGFHRLKKSSRYDEDVTQTYYKTLNKITVPVKRQTFSSKNQMSAISFQQYFKSVDHAYGIQKDMGMCISKQNGTGLTVAAIKT